MEDKKYIRISLSTICLIIALIVIVVMGYFMYNMYNKINKEQKEDVASADYENQLSSLQQEINELKSETITKVDNNIVENTTTNNVTNTSENDKTEDKDTDKQEFSNNEVKKKFEKLLHIQVARYSDPTYVFDELGIKYKTTGRFIETNDKDTDDASYWTKTNIEYKTFKSKMLEVMSEKLYKDLSFPELYIEKSGKVCYLETGASGVTDKIISVKYVGKNKYIIKDECDSEGGTVTYTYEVIVANVNGKCVIDSYKEK